jgi:hypothetical protein
VLFGSDRRDMTCGGVSRCTSRTITAVSERDRNPSDRGRSDGERRKPSDGSRSKSNYSSDKRAGRGSRTERSENGRQGGRPAGRNSSRESGNPTKGPGVERPERFFGNDARGSKWGGVARRGAHNASIDPGGPRSKAEENEAVAPPERTDERWERVRPGKEPPKRSKNRKRTVDLPQISESHMRGMSDEQRKRTRRRLGDAAEDFLAERFGDVEKVLAPLSKQYPQIPEVQELYGLTLYRLGKWSAAITALEMFGILTGDIDQLPVLADCHRALGRHGETRSIWEELRAAGPDAPTMTEGRIVMSGSMADQGDLQGAIRLLEQGPVRSKSPKEHHLRLWYALADLYERAGERQRARRGFDRIESTEPGYADVYARIRSLG